MQNVLRTICSISCLPFDVQKRHSTTKPSTYSLSLFLTGEAKSIGQRTGIVEVERALGEGKLTACKVLTIP